MLVGLTLQLFWWSFALIGMAFIVFMHKELHLKYRWLALVNDLPPPAQIFILFVLGLFLASPLIILSYFLLWPVVISLIFYLLLLIFSLFVLARHRKIILKHLSGLFSSIKKIGPLALVLTALALASLVTDYVLALKVGSPLYGDSEVQIAKINLFIHSRFTLADPYYFLHGVVDPRYSTNIMNGYQAVAAQLLHAKATAIWLYSFAFYRLLIWLGFFTLFYKLLPKKFRYLSYLLLAIAPLVLSSFFSFATLPDRIILAWICLLMVGLMYWYKNRSNLLLLVASTLVATTHALFALFCLIFMLFFVVILRLCRFIRNRDIFAPLVSCLILLVPVLLNLYYPNHTNQDQQSYNAGLAPPPLHRYGLFKISQLPSFGIATLILYGLAVTLLLLVFKLKDRRLKLILYAGLCVLVGSVFNTAYLQFAGYGFLLWAMKDNRDRIMAGFLIAFYSLFIYNPLFWRLAGKSIPPWIIARISVLNVIGPLAAFLALAVFVLPPFMNLSTKRRWLIAAPLLIFFSVIFAYMFNGTIPAAYAWTSNISKNNSAQQKILNGLEKLSPKLNRQIIYSNDPDLSMIVPDVVVSNVISYHPANESPMVNIKQRAQCSELLAKHPSQANFSSSGATIYLTDYPYAKTVRNLALRSSYLHQEAAPGPYSLYQITGSAKAGLHTVCSLVFGQ